MVCVADFALDLMKVPGGSRRQPRWVADFDWEARETRHAVARRTADAYCPRSLRPDTERLFELDRSDGSNATLGCRDVYLVWAGDTKIGLKQDGSGCRPPVRTLGSRLNPCGGMRMPLYAERTSTGGNRSGDTGFRDRELPTPKMGLKPRLSREVPR